MKKLGTYILSGLVLGGAVISNLQPVFANDNSKELVESQTADQENAEIWEKTYQENAECKVEIVDEIPCES